MSACTIAALYQSYDDALQTLRELDAARFPLDALALVASAAEHHWYVPAAPEVNSAAFEGGTSLGTVLGGGAGLLAGMGLIPLPGGEPLIGQGWWVPMLIGASAGAGVGSLLGLLAETAGAGISPGHTLHYLDAAQRDGTIVIARVDVEDLPTIQAIMRRHRPLEIDDRAAAYCPD